MLDHGPSAARPLAHAAVDVAHVAVALLTQRTQGRFRAVLRVADQEHGLVGTGRDFVNPLAQLPHGQKVCACRNARGVFLRLPDIDQQGSTRFVCVFRPIVTADFGIVTAHFG